MMCHCLPYSCALPGPPHYIGCPTYTPTLYSDHDSLAHLFSLCKSMQVQQRYYMVDHLLLAGTAIVAQRADRALAD